ncbi:MAG: tRNA uridine-5-carboxymethylaminomethyl(34) synthesis GTPase MnmE, partial [Synergistaceae bacterium]|nr:tRNA uridine-5-carboxymethylaminomethyl(34) synthesis GTPase MnmE [Synergistaceae bacterium]
IVRISGPDAVSVSQKFLARKDFPEHAKMYLTSLIADGETVDRVLCVHFMKPKSYTGEDVIEIHTHGGILAAQTCLALAVSNGARVAEPGEFTRRAFVNGHIDLAQAEGVLSLISSRSNEAMKAAARTLTGELSRAVMRIHDEILSLQGRIEIELDFPEGETLTGLDVSGEIGRIISGLEELIPRCSAGMILSHGVRVVISGRPNAGKSSLLNALVSKKRAIVTEIPGTTRDIIEESIIIGGVPVRLYDTAGLRESDDVIEAEGVRLAVEAMNESDICVYVVDGSRDLSAEDSENIRGLEGRQTIIAVNKSDLESKAGDVDSLCPKINVSAKNGEGIEALKSAIYEMAVKNCAVSSGLNVSAFQLEELRGALRDLREGEESAVIGAGDDVTAGLLGSARLRLLRVLGVGAGDELIDSMFRRFCVGK